ncbi:DUF1304 domain-containing protein [Chromobacterium amazonense]|nr:DUF1304 domain-containing protein [Chromobacterium amazonense]
MSMAANLVIIMVALSHLYFLALEMFLWDRPLGMKTFRLTPEKARETKALAANQGLYNGFLAAGLAWGLWLGAQGFQIKLFFLACVLAAGVFGALTVSRRIFFAQGLPAALGIALLLLA